MENTVNTTRTQVVIIGGGPTGLSLAAQLQRFNISFIILEKKETTTVLSKAIVVQARTLEIFEELGLAAKAVATGMITTAMQLFYKGKQRAAIDLKGLGTGISQFPFALSLEQSKTERLLADHLKENGISVQWNSTFDNIEETENEISVYYHSINGNAGKIVASYVVGCDGAGSELRHKMGLKFEGSTEPKLFYVADVILNSPVIQANELYMFMIRKGFVLFFPMEGIAHYRVIGILPDVTDFEKEFSFADIQDTIRKDICVEVNFEELKWFSSYKVHSRKASSFRKGRIFLAGDAAHIHTPAGGQGMNTGIQDGYNLAWKLAHTLKYKTNDHLIESYNTERMNNAENLLRSTDRMFDVMAGINPFLNFLRLNFFPPVLGLVTKSRFIQKRVFPLISQTGIAYRESYLTVKSAVGKVKAGDRMHYFVFANGRNIFSYLTRPSFKLLFFGDPGKFQKSTSEWKIKIEQMQFEEVPKALFGNERDFYILLRPDNHISYIGKDTSTCRKLIEKIFPDS